MSKAIELKLALESSRKDSLEGKTEPHEIVMKEIGNTIKKYK